MERYLSILWLNLNEPLHSRKQTNKQSNWISSQRICKSSREDVQWLFDHRTWQNKTNVNTTSLNSPTDWTPKVYFKTLWRSLITYSKTKQFYVFSDIAEWGEVMVSFCNCVWNALCTCPGTHTSFLHGETKFQLQWPWIHFQFGEKTLIVVLGKKYCTTTSSQFSSYRYS